MPASMIAIFFLSTFAVMIIMIIPPDLFLPGISEKVFAPVVNPMQVPGGNRTEEVWNVWINSFATAELEPAVR